MASKDTTSVGVRLDKSIHAYLKEKAEKLGVSLSVLVEQLARLDREKATQPEPYYDAYAPPPAEDMPHWLQRDRTLPQANMPAPSDIQGASTPPAHSAHDITAPSVDYGDVDLMGDYLAPCGSCHRPVLPGKMCKRPDCPGYRWHLKHAGRAWSNQLATDPRQR
jgi:hypothetical protein